MSDPSELQPGDALLLVDVQRDFCAGGALAVPDGDAVVPVLNRWIDAAAERGLPVVASRDWHPEDHCSFTEAGGPWPAHCRRDTDGAAFHPGLRLPEDVLIIDKGTMADREQYSAFDGTPLVEQLRDRMVRRVWVGGLALDYCVRASVLDARAAGFEVRVIVEATRAVDVEPGDGAAALAAMRDAGAGLTRAEVVHG